MNDILKDILLVLLSGSVGAGIVKLVGDRLAWKRSRIEKKEDRALQKQDEAEARANQHIEARLKAIETKTDAQSVALKFMLYDRIRYLGQAYIRDGEIDFDDRRILSEMHKSYHDGLGGNGDLDVLMREVNALPLKVRPK